MIMPPPGGMPPGGMSPEMMQQAPMMPQQAPPQEQMPDPAQMQQAVIQRLQELEAQVAAAEAEKQELMHVLSNMGFQGGAGGVEMTNPGGAMGGLLGLTGQEIGMQGDTPLMHGRLEAAGMPPVRGQPLY